MSFVHHYFGYREMSPNSDANSENYINDEKYKECMPNRKTSKEKKTTTTKKKRPTTKRKKSLWERIAEW